MTAEAVEPAIDRAAVEAALEEIRPFLHGEHGGIDLVDIEDGRVRVRLTGACADCGLRQVTLRTGVERVLMARVAGVTEVVHADD